MSKPDDIPQEVWGAAAQPSTRVQLDVVAGQIWDIRPTIARVIMAAKAEASRDLVDCLEDMTTHYVELASSGDCGFWDAEKEIKVIAARKMIAAHKRGEG